MVYQWAIWTTEGMSQEVFSCWVSHELHKAGVTLSPPPWVCPPLSSQEVLILGRGGLERNEGTWLGLLFVNIEILLVFESPNVPMLG